MGIKHFAVLLFAIAFLAPAVSAQYEQLAQTYAPVLKYNSGELFYSCPAEYGVQNSNLMQYNGGPSLVESNPNPTSIASYTAETYYLDNKLGWFNEIAAGYQGQMSSLRPTIYYHVVQGSQYTAIQYWFYYAFNNGPINNHEGDWENIVILVNGAGVPEWAVYSQHQGGSRVAWNEVEKVAETHPVVYPGRASHANYFRSYEGKFGLQNDEVGGNGITITPDQASLVSLDTNPSWLSFGGRWGDWGTAMSEITGARGPFGPSAGNHAQQWADPISWAIGQPQKSGGAFMVDWLVYNFVLLYIIVFLVLVGFKMIGIVRKAQKGELQVGKLLSSLFSVWLFLGIIGTLILFLGMFLPWYSVSGVVQAEGLQTNGVADLVKIDGNGLQVNTLERGAGMSTIFAAMIPLGLLLLASVVMTVLDLMNAKSGKSLGLKYLLGGIMPVIYFIVLIVVVSMLGSVINGVRPMLGQEGIPAETEGLLNSVAGAPFSGGYQGGFGGYAYINITWGMGMGIYLIFIGGIIKIIAGIAMIASAPKVEKKQPSKPLPQVVVYQQPSVQYPQIQYYQPAQQIPQQPQYTQVGKQTMLVCKKCGTPSDGHSNFCDKCGYRVK